MSGGATSPGDARTDTLPDALAGFAAVAARLGDRPAVFLDYDGTLSPIVDDPDEARLTPGVADLLVRLARRCPVAVVSGRALDDLRPRVGLEGVHYAGSHGFDIRTAAGETFRPFDEVRPALTRAAERLQAALADVPGARVEEKGFAVAVHVRGVRDPELEARALDAVAEVAGEAGLRATGGKKVAEVRPDVDWHKGRAVEWFLDRWRDGGPPPVGLYVGDDVTDEDGFRSVVDDGVAVIVRPDPPRLTAARWGLEDPAAVAAFLGRLADRVGA